MRIFECYEQFYKKITQMIIFEHPEIKKLFDLLYNKLLEESGRGAILIATAHLDDYLTDLIVESFPDEMSKNHREKLLKYPGTISSFSSKIELAYSFRLINKNLHESLNALRKVRNDAAHSLSKFELHELNEKMVKVYNLGPNIQAVVKNMATELIVGSKIISLSEIYDEQNYTEEQRKENLIRLFDDPEKIKIIDQQLPYWELIVGLCIICGMLINSRERISQLKQGVKTWDNLLEKE